MGLAVSTFQGLPAHRQTLSLESTQYRLRLTWRPRLRGWYADLYTLDEAPLALGRRLSAGWGPFFGLSLPNGPDGLFVVRGLDGYAQGDLGGALKLLYYTRAELAAAAPAAEPDVFVRVL